MHPLKCQRHLAQPPRTAKRKSSFSSRRAAGRGWRCASAGLLPSGRYSRAAGSCCRRGSRVKALLGQGGGVQRQLATWVLFNTVHWFRQRSAARRCFMRRALMPLDKRVAPAASASAIFFPPPRRSPAFCCSAHRRSMPHHRCRANGARCGADRLETPYVARLAPEGFNCCTFEINRLVRAPRLPQVLRRCPRGPGNGRAGTPQPVRFGRGIVRPHRTTGAEPASSAVSVRPLTRAAPEQRWQRCQQPAP